MEITKKPHLFFSILLVQFLFLITITSVVSVVNAQSNSHDSEIWYNKGNDLTKLGKFHEAIIAYDRAIEIDPNNSDAWNGKGFTLNKLDKYTEALQASNKAIEINPNNSDGWSTKGYALAKLGKYDEALQASNKAIESNSQNSMGWTNKALALSKLNRNDEAITAADKAIELNPLNSMAWNNKGDALSKLNLNDEAIKVYNKAIEISPHNSLAQSNLRNALRFTKTPNPNTPISNTPNSNTPISNTPNSNTPSPNTPNSNTPSPNTPNSNTPSPNTPSSNTPSPNTPNSNTPSPNTPSSNTPSPNTPNSNTPSSNTPNSNTPSSNTPNSNTPSSNTPGSMLDTMTELISSANQYTFDQQITFLAKVGTTSHETEKPSGTITFIDGNRVIGTGIINSGQAILTISELSVGSHSITAQYSGDNKFKPSTSSAFALTITELKSPHFLPQDILDTITELTCSATQYTSGQPITFTVKVSVPSQEIETPSGTINLIDGNKEIGHGPVNSGQFLFTTTDFLVGAHSIRAQFIGNKNFKSSESDPFTLTVKKESIFQHPLFPVSCGAIFTVVGWFIKKKFKL
jgi:Flp pilus assembly protein TadD